MFRTLELPFSHYGTQVDSNNVRCTVQTGDQGELHGRACVRKNRIEGRVSVHSSTPLFLPKSKHTHNNNNNKLPKDWLIA